MKEFDRNGVNNMLNKGDSIAFVVNNKQQDEIYKAISDECQHKGDGRLVVNLEGYNGEVAVEYLKKIN